MSDQAKSYRSFCQQWKNISRMDLSISPHHHSTLRRIDRSSVTEQNSFYIVEINSPDLEQPLLALDLEGI